MNNMMKVTSVICIKKMGSNCTPCLPRKIATPATIRPSKYRRKKVEDIERRGSSQPLQGQMQKEIYQSRTE